MLTPRIQTDKHLAKNTIFPPKPAFPNHFRGASRPRWSRRRLHGAAAELGTRGVDLGASQRPAALGVGGGAVIGRGAGAGDESRG